MRRLFLFLAFFAAFSYGHAQEQETETMDALRNRVFNLARVQAEYMDSLLTAMEMPGRAGHDVMAGPDRPSRLNDKGSPSGDVAKKKGVPGESGGAPLVMVAVCAHDSLGGLEDGQHGRDVRRGGGTDHHLS